MWETGLHLDFVTIDGSLSADGHDPLNINHTREASHLRALSFFRRSIEQYELECSLIASGNIVTEYDILKSVALGADACYCMAPMVLALGRPLFQKLAAQRLRVANFHRNTLQATAKLMKQCGYYRLKDVNARDFFLTTSHYNIKTLHEIYFNNHPVKGPKLFTGLS
jgi:glutamate synthase domain-containing protein 2